MEAKEIRELSREEMGRKAEELKQVLFNLRFQHGTGQLENPKKIPQAKKDLARVLTILRETELNRIKE